MKMKSDYDMKEEGYQLNRLSVCLMGKTANLSACVQVKDSLSV